MRVSWCLLQEGFPLSRLFGVLGTTEAPCLTSVNGVYCLYTVGCEKDQTQGRRHTARPHREWSVIWIHRRLGLSCPLPCSLFSDGDNEGSELLAPRLRLFLLILLLLHCTFHSFSKHLLGTYCVPDPLLGTWDVLQTKTPGLWGP